MASTITKAPILRAVSTRGYSQLAPIGGISNYDIKTTTLSNRVLVASAENESPITRISVVFRAGSRYETSDNVGVTHVLRTCAGLSTKGASQFAIIRNIQQVGASLSATSDRETISYTLEGTRQAVERALPFLAEVASQQVFKPWEVSDIGNRLKLELATRPLQLRAVDLLHKAAFRRGLGNSLFVPKFQIGRISSETLQHYVASNFTGGRAAVVGLGIDGEKLSQFATGLNLQGGEGNNDPSPYKGGEVRSDKGGSIAYVAVAGEGASLKNSKEALAFAVLQRAIGTGPHVKYSAIDNGPLTKAVSGSTSDQYTTTAINASYSDTGIFGILLAVPSASASKPVASAINFFKKASITDEDVNRGKNQLKTALLLEAENGTSALHNMGTQAVLLGNVVSANNIASAIDSVSKDEVAKAFQKAARSKLSIAAVGDLSKVPYADEI